MKIKKILISKSNISKFSSKIAPLLKQKDVILLRGDFGVGKTYFSSLLIKKLSNSSIVNSPSFNLIKTYKMKNNLEIWHCDFYRLQVADEVEQLGVFDEMHKKIIIIEWAKFELLYELNALLIDLEFGQKKNDRFFNFHLTDAWNKRLNFL